jgi:hypothetical protein
MDECVSDFQQTCQYLKGQLAEINNRLNERETNNSLNTKGRSKSVDDEALKKCFQSSLKQRDNNKEVNLDEEENSCSEEVSDNFYDDDEENSIFKEDELEKTLIDSSNIVSTATATTDSLNRVVTVVDETKREREEESILENGDVQKEMDEVSSSTTPSTTIDISTNVVVVSIEESNDQTVFEKFFKSFNTTLNSDEIKKQNAENYNKIVDLLKKSNQKQPIATSNEDGLILSENSPKPKVATELFKQETHTPPPPPVITITTDTISKKVLDEEIEQSEEKMETPLMSKQLVDLSSTDLIKLLLKIDSKTIDANKQQQQLAQTWVIINWITG